MMVRLNAYRRVFWIAAVLTLAAFATPATALSATAKSKFYDAERCYGYLKKNPSLQKYRDRWFRCINKYLGVHKHSPRGPWAAAGLYHAGVLYTGLYRHSYYAGDKKEAIDLFDRVIQGYPKSRYRPKALNAKKQLLQGKPKSTATTASTQSAARVWYKRAQAKYRQIQQNPKFKVRRDKWLACIGDYQKAFDADTDGPLAAAALFGSAQSYREMYAKSYRASDKQKGDTHYRKVIDRFPGSPYAQKAAKALGIALPEKARPSATDGISQVIEQNIAKRSAPMGNGRLATAQSPATIEGLRFWSNPRYTRVVIDADRDTVFTYRELREDPSIKKPQRIYIDVHNSRLGKIQKVVPINDNLLSDARAGQYTNDTVRVVVDIKSFQTFKIFSLKNPFRVVLDVWGKTEEQYAGKPSPPTPAAKSDGKLPPSAIVKQLALGVRRIVIDPGHGGKDYGAPGYLKGVHEKHVVLQIAKHLQTMIKNELKCDAILTRYGDTFLSLEERTAIANTKNADLFISIHTNASSDRRAHGIETYILNLATDDEAIRVAAMENATSTKNISDLDSILQDLMKNAKVSESTRLASYVQQNISKSLKSKYKHIRSKGIKQAPFYVLLGADMPSILIETSFISNPRECKRLKSANYQKQLCRGIVEGIKRYIKETNPVAFQPPVRGRGKG